MDINYRVILDPSDQSFRLGRFKHGEWQDSGGLWHSDRRGTDNNPIPARVSDRLHITIQLMSYNAADAYQVVVLFARNKHGRTDPSQPSTPFSKNNHPEAAFISNPNINQNGILVLEPQTIAAKGFFEFSILLRTNPNDASRTHDFTRDPELDVTESPNKK